MNITVVCAKPVAVGSLHVRHKMPRIWVRRVRRSVEEPHRCSSAIDVRRFELGCCEIRSRYDWTTDGPAVVARGRPQHARRSEDTTNDRETAPIITIAIAAAIMIEKRKNGETP